MLRKVLWGGFALFMASFALKIAQAQQGPQFMLTWTAHGSYTPPGYVGKALPNQNSQITASLALISGGQLVNLKNRTIYWYLNDTFIGGGVGAQNISFSPLGEAPTYLSLKAEIPNYNGNLVVDEVQIPLVQPKAVIEIQHVNGQFSSNPLALQGTPYYFNTPNPTALSYQWSVNGQSPSSAENPETLLVNLDQGTPSGSNFSVNLRITNPTDSMNAADSTNLTYIKQL